MKLHFSIELDEQHITPLLWGLGRAFGPQFSNLASTLMIAAERMIADSASPKQNAQPTDLPPAEDRPVDDGGQESWEAEFKAADTQLGEQYEDGLMVEEEPTTTTTAEPKPKRKRRTKAEIEAEKAKVESEELSQPELPFEPDQVNTTAPPEVTNPVETVKEIMQEQAKIAFPSPHDFLRAAYAADKVKARTVCQEFLAEIAEKHPERNVAAMQDLNDDEFQQICHRIVDAGIAPMPE